MLTNTTRTAAYLPPKTVSDSSRPALITADSRSRTPKELCPPRVRKQTDHAREEAGEEYDHPDAHAGALVRDSGQADDGADEEDRAEGDGDEGAGKLDAVGWVVEYVVCF